MEEFLAEGKEVLKLFYWAIHLLIRNRKDIIFNISIKLHFITLNFVQDVQYIYITERIFFQPIYKR